MFVNDEYHVIIFFMHCNNNIFLVVDFSFLRLIYQCTYHPFFFFLQLEVDFAIGRDITPETVDRVTEVLQDW